MINFRGDLRSRAVARSGDRPQRGWENRPAFPDLLADRFDTLRPITRTVALALFIVIAHPLLTWGQQDHGGAAQRAPQPLIPVGTARVDVTPRQPVHLINELSPKELEGIGQRLYARALAIGSDEQGAAVLVSFDGIGVPRQVTAEVARRLQRRFGIPRTRVVICATHTHWAPHLTGLLPTIFGGPLPEEQQRRVDRYTANLTDWLEDAAARALGNRRPRRLSWAEGRLGIAANRALDEGGRTVLGEDLLFTYNPKGPVDHSFPVLFAHEPDGALSAVLFTYACHNVALTLRDISGFRNKVHGDWAGLSQEMIEARHPGCVAIATIGCGGDARPSPLGGIAVAEAHARHTADEVDRLLQGHVPKKPLTVAPQGRIQRTRLPLESLPDSATLRRYVEKGKTGGRNDAARGYLAQKMLQRIEQGEQPVASVPYAVQTWTFDRALAMVFLEGEVVARYRHRLDREFDRGRLWVVAYANATPCYIPSKRLLAMRSYEADRSMHYYGYIRRFVPDIEDMVVEAVQKLLPHD